MDKTKDITAIIVGRDQSLTLADAIRSVAPLPVVYFDAGSRDKSRQLAADLGATVLTDDAVRGGGPTRNYAAAHAQTEYCLSLAPDDVLRPGSLDAIAAFLQSSPRGGSLWIQEARSPHRHYATRIWRRDARWIGRAHEYLDTPPTDCAGAEIIHMRGPWHDRPSDPDGVIKSLCADLAEQPANPRWWFYLAREYHDHAAWSQAIPLFEHYVRISQFPAETADAWYMLGRCYWAIGRGDDARSAIAKAVMIVPEFREAWRAWSSFVHPHASAKFAAIAETCNNAGTLFAR